MHIPDEQLAPVRAAPAGHRRRPARLPQGGGGHGRVRRPRLRHARPRPPSRPSPRPARSSPRSRCSASAAAGTTRTIPPATTSTRTSTARACPRSSPGSWCSMRTSSRCRGWRPRSRATRTARCGRSPSARTPAGRTTRPCPRATSSGRGSGSSIPPAPRPMPPSSTTSRTARPSTRRRSPTPKEVGVRAKDDWTLEVTLEGPARLLPRARRLSRRPAGLQRAVEKFGDKWTEAGNIVSNGPFILEAWEHNKQMCSRRIRTTSAPRTCT